MLLLALLLPLLLLLPGDDYLFSAITRDLRGEDSAGSDSGCTIRSRVVVLPVRGDAADDDDGNGKR